MEGDATRIGLAAAAPVVRAGAPVSVNTGVPSSTM